MNTLNNAVELDEYDRLDRVAMETPCAVEGCDGAAHDGGETPEEWSHGFDWTFGGAVEANFLLSRGEPWKAVIYMSVSSGSLAPAEWRAEAETFEAFPAWLRAVADEVDRRNA